MPVVGEEFRNARRNFLEIILQRQNSLNDKIGVLNYSLTVTSSQEIRYHAHLLIEEARAELRFLQQIYTFIYCILPADESGSEQASI